MLLIYVEKFKQNSRLSAFSGTQNEIDDSIVRNVLSFYISFCFIGCFISVWLSKPPQV